MLTDAYLNEPGPTILFVNRAFTRLTGFSADDVLGQNPRMLQGRDTDRSTLQRLKHRLQSGQAFEGRVVNYRKNGQPFTLEWYIEPLRDETGRIAHFVAVQRDASHEEARELSFRHLNAAFEHAEEAILVLSGTGTVQYCNSSARALFGEQVSLPSEIWDLLRSGVPWQGTLNVVVDQDPRQLNARVRPVPGAYSGEKNFVVTAHDVTEVERLKSIAQSVNLSDNIGHFLSGIRHELGNPTNSIKTALTVLRSNLETFERSKVYEYFDHLLSEVARIEHLLRSLRSFTAHESIQLENIEVGALVDKIAALVRPDMNRARVHFEVSEAPTGRLFVDVRALYQVFINLFSNAIEAVEGLSGSRISVEFAPGANSIDIMVIDNGQGISDSQIRKVVQPFYTTKRTGTGLGLSIVARLVERHDGTLRIAHEPRGGTRAIVTLPFTPPGSTPRF